MLVIPVSNLPSYKIDVSLDNLAYRLEFSWNSDYDFWTMNISTIDDVILIQGVKLIINYELIRRYARADLPPGALIPIDVTGKLDRISQLDLGTNILLVYTPEAELNGII